METFRVRLNCIDYYQAVPSEFDPPVPHGLPTSGKDRPKVSVIRVFGSTETGQKVLMHVHGVFQYCYIRYSGSLEEEDVNVAISTLRLAIDQALALSFRKGAEVGKNTYVAHISLVKGVPFYGYKVGYQFYLKIYLLSPSHMTRLADMLREGTIMKRVLQPYESHMQYLAQWMCDYNLFGCAYIDCEKVKFRAPVPEYMEMNSATHVWHDQSIPSESISNIDALPKQSHCSLEVDVHVQDILNRKSVTARPLHHDFIERLQPIPQDAKLVPSMAGLWKDEERRRKARMGITDPDGSPFGPEVMVTMSADLQHSEPGGWIHEEEFRQRVEQIALEESEQSNHSKIDVGSFVHSAPSESTIQTALESVEDLYPANYPLQGPGLGQQDMVAVEDVGNQEMLGDEDRVEEFRNGFVVERSVRSFDTDKKTSSIDTPPEELGCLEGDPRSLLDPQTHDALGVRKSGDLSDVSVAQADAEKDNHTPHLRTHPSDPIAPRKPKKRPRLLIDSDQVLPAFRRGSNQEAPDLPQSNQECEAQVGTLSKQSDVSRSQQSNSQKSKGLLDAKLAFPVVKDPNDPNTLLRLSQNSTLSLQSSPEKCSSLARAPSTLQVSPAKLSSLDSQQTISSPRLLSSVPSGMARRGPDTRTIVFATTCPAFSDVASSLAKAGVPDIIYQNAYYSDERDVPKRPREYAGRVFKLESATVPYLPAFDATGASPATFGEKVPILLDRVAEEREDQKRRRLCKIRKWTIAEPPPTKAAVLEWLSQEGQQEPVTSHHAQPKTTKAKSLSQIDGPTQKNAYGFKFSQKQASNNVQQETQYMSVMSLEIHADTRAHLSPDPAHDEIACAFWCVQSDDDEHTGSQGSTHTGILVNDRGGSIAKTISRDVPVEVEAVSSELEILTRITDIVRLYDPDILTGYEVHNSSWGFLIERAWVHYEMNLCDELSRMKSQSHGRFRKEEDRWGFNQTSTIRITGRHMINIWRAMRGELNLLQYTMENVAFHVLHRRIPHYKFIDLTTWYRSGVPRYICRTVEYYVSRVQIDLAILDANELISRTSEQARLLGVDWYSVISRGSQFKVESLMFRIAKPENLILVSPSRRQVGGQNALECLPLVMEPQSDFYTSPVLVLDFQSLYPSVMIAYNYCYSTFLGRVVGWRGTNKMGFTDYNRQKRLIELLKDDINIAPNGIMYVKNKIRRSLLAKMLKEILETRVMVKSGMKVDQDDKTLQRLLNNRQLALKLIANVTYGYTSASFSGRMPCSEIADSIVQTGRETLERAIAMIHAESKWNAEVVYGDTDSLFVYLKGRTRDQAFDIGEEIAAAITAANPRPVKLKFEKVYHPCVLLAKKRYVGFKYESRDQTVPDFDAKGIETVRRDGTPAEQKIEETALKILFRTADLSQVKSFFQAQCTKILQGRISVQDFCFAREVKLGTYSDKGPPPAGALISARRMIQDPRTEPQYGERVPYVVVTGAPGARLIDRCVAPDTLLQDPHLSLDANYYISKNLIPPLERIFNLVGANVRAWFDELPKIQRIRRIQGLGDGTDQRPAKKTTLESYLRISSCIVCRKPVAPAPTRGATSSSSSSSSSAPPLCASCSSTTGVPHTALVLQSRLTAAERKVQQLMTVCRSCANVGFRASDDEVKCDSKDCPVFYSRTRKVADLRYLRASDGVVLRGLLKKEEQRGGGLEW